MLIKHPIGGGCTYCPAVGCRNFAHFEDGSEYYPFCEKHAHRNHNYGILQRESVYVREMAKEVANFNQSAL